MATIWVNRTITQPKVSAASAMAAVAASTPLLQSPSERRLRLLNQLKAECALLNRDSVDFRSHVHQVLRGTYLPCQSVEGTYPSTVSWVEAVCEMKEPCDALDQSLLAFCAIQVRVAGEDSISYEDTVQLYNDALGTIIQDLDQGKGTQDETLGAIVTISTCEVNPS